MHQVSQLTLLSDSEVKPEKSRMSRFRVPTCVTLKAHISMLELRNSASVRSRGSNIVFSSRGQASGAATKRQRQHKHVTCWNARQHTVATSWNERQPSAQPTWPRRLYITSCSTSIISSRPVTFDILKCTAAATARPAQSAVHAICGSFLLTQGTVRSTLTICSPLGMSRSFVPLPCGATPSCQTL